MADEARVIVSSAEHLTGADRKAKFDATLQGWHSESWRLYRSGGEYSAAVGWIANGLSEFTFCPEVWTDGEWLPDENQTAYDTMRLLGNQNELLLSWGKNSCVVAEAVLVFADGHWSLRSRDEVAFDTDRKLRLNEYGDTHTGRRRGTSTITGPAISDIWRIWLPDAQFSKLSWTPVAAFLTDLEQLRLLREVLNSKLNTRLWLNGMLFFGQSLALPTQTSDDTPGRGSSFLAQLRNVMEANIKRKNSSAKDVLPVMLQVTSQEVGKVMEAWYPETTIDEREAALRHEIRNTLRELFDLPIEAQTGMGDTNHWGSWAITDVNKIYSLMPRARALLNAISFSWYRKQLVDGGMSAEDAALRRLAPEASALRGEPSSDEVRQAHDRFVVSDKALRAATRLPEESAPDEDEYVRGVGRKMGKPYLALWGTKAWVEIDDADDWDKAGGAKEGAPGIGADTPERAPGVGEPGSPTDPNSEVETEAP